MQEDRILEKLVHLAEKVDKLDEKLLGMARRGSSASMKSECESSRMRVHNLEDHRGFGNGNALRNRGCAGARLLPGYSLLVLLHAAGCQYFEVNYW